MCYKITQEQRDRAKGGSNTPVWRSDDARVTHFLRADMRIAIRTQDAWENDVWHGPYSQTEARRLAQDYINGEA